MPVKRTIRLALGLSLFILGTGCRDLPAGLEGTVEAGGVPVAGAFVEAFDRAPDGIAAAAASANTDSAGRFALFLPAGRYWLCARKKPQGSGGGGMLQGETPGPVTVSRGMAKAQPLVLRDSSGEGRGGGGTPVSGRVLAGGLPRAGAFVYLYPEGVRRGPGYAARTRSGADGFFRLFAPPGRYQLMARLREDGESMGTLSAGVLVGEARGEGGKEGSAITVGASPVEAGTVPLRPLDPRLLSSREWGGGGGKLLLTGRILDERGRPVAGVHAFLYPDYRMVGKPAALSAPTGADGIYRLTVPGNGDWYLGARSRFGGPVEPGERMGVHEVDGMRAPVRIAPGAEIAAVDMVVRETW